MSTFHLIIRTPDQEVLNEPAESLTLATEEKGVMQIFPHHASLTGTVFFSPIKVKTKNHQEEFIAKKGVVLVSNEENSVTLLVLSCEKRKEISLQTTKEYLEFIAQKLKEGKDLSQYQITHLESEKITLEMTLKELGK